MKFGTDGIRGLANRDVTPELALALGRASARVLGGPTMVVGRDTRRSGHMIEAAFVAGVLSEGVDVELVGVAPTPAVAFRAQVAGVPAAMISASHNPFEDNGIKVFARGGLKLDDQSQATLEAALGDLLDAGVHATDGSPGVPVGTELGSVAFFDVAEPYLNHLAGSLFDGSDAAPGDGTPGDGSAGVGTAGVGTAGGHRPLAGLSVVLDCGHGAASALAADAFERSGATVTLLNVTPDGVNINRACGSTDTSGLSAAVVDVGADLGFAFDGDADRMLAVDAAGEAVDGDHLIAIAAIDLKSRGGLVADTVVVTVMTNLGFRKGMEREGVSVVVTGVGDRYVLEALDAGGYVLGGEQSGHIIFRDRATTGDGLLSALMIAAVVCRSGRTLADLAATAMTRLPQVLQNVRIASPMPDVAQRIAASIEEAERSLGDDGRVLVRPSGTEPVVRIMVEATELAEAHRWTDALCAAVAAL